MRSPFLQRPAPPVLRSAAFVMALLAPPALAASLEERVQTCAACHGEGGNSSTPLIPSLAAQPNFFLMNQLILIREGVRKIPAMQDVVKGMKDDEILALAGHYSAAPAKKSEETPDPAKVARGAQIAATHHCGSCHTPALTGQDQMPRIAGQRIDYMVMSLKGMRDSTRTSADPLMAEAVYGLSDVDLEALAHFAASK